MRLTHSDDNMELFKILLIFCISIILNACDRPIKTEMVIEEKDSVVFEIIGPVDIRLINEQASFELRRLLMCDASCYIVKVENKYQNKNVILFTDLFTIFGKHLVNQIKVVIY